MVCRRLYSGVVFPLVGSISTCNNRYFYSTSSPIVSEASCLGLLFSQRCITASLFAGPFHDRNAAHQSDSREGPGRRIRRLGALAGPRALGDTNGRAWPSRRDVHCVECVIDACRFPDISSDHVRRGREWSARPALSLADRRGGRSHRPRKGRPESDVTQ